MLSVSPVPLLGGDTLHAFIHTTLYSRTKRLFCVGNAFVARLGAFVAQHTCQLSGQAALCQRFQRLRAQLPPLYGRFTLRQRPLALLTFMLQPLLGAHPRQSLGFRACRSHRRIASLAFPCDGLLHDSVHIRLRKGPFLPHTCFLDSLFPCDLPLRSLSLWGLHSCATLTACSAVQYCKLFHGSSSFYARRLLPR